MCRWNMKFNFKPHHEYDLRKISKIWHYSHVLKIRYTEDFIYTCTYKFTSTSISYNTDEGKGMKIWFATLESVLKDNLHIGREILMTTE